MFFNGLIRLYNPISNVKASYSTLLESSIHSLENLSQYALTQELVRLINEYGIV